MDDIASGVDPDELMDLDEAEGSDLDEEDEELPDDPIPSPFQLPSSGPGSTATSTASSPPNNDDIPHFNFSGKPLSIKRGRGRPRREEGKSISRRSNAGNRSRKWKPPGVVRGITKKVKSFDSFDFQPVPPSPSDDLGLLDPETGTLVFPEREKIMPAPEELPYAPEQWPGKVCAFCNLSERSQLGQGELLRLNCPEGFIPQRIASEQNMQLAANNSQNAERDAGDKSPRGPVTCRRQKSFNKCRHPSMTSEYVDELTIIGHLEHPDIQSLFETGYFYVHRNCALWSNGVVRNENSSLENVGFVLLRSISQKCSYCNHFGASLACKAENCTKAYHYPCATASGAFQELGSATLFCSQHLTEVSGRCGESNACYTCKLLGDIANLMFCSSCGEHYHGTCVGLAQLPGVRAGWQCRKCKVCQVCRIVGDESKLMACEQCDKVYHSVCQRPIVTTIPKYGWKCRCCRVCGDCGSRTPGAGLSSRWHAHYTVCDSCYQQRNKGFSCPLCHRAYRAHANREMVQCTLCRKFVHGGCDPEADLLAYHQRKETYPEYEYVCLNCKNLTQPGRALLAKRNSVDECTDSMSASQESLYDENLEFDSDRPTSEDTNRTIGIGKGKPYSASKIAKKRLSLGNGPPGRPKGIGKTIPAGKMGFVKRQRFTEFGRKRGPKSKIRGVFGVPGVGLQRPVSDGSKTDEEPGVENKLVLCSAKDKFILTQDLCVMCGAMGTDQEGCLISCVQCGQCYHPYCVNVKVTKVILQKGWRCLDCTVCEGCGQRNDEARLILCDDCDISYHIYCMDPPLDYVPHGNWKCKWCAICQSCGSTDPGFNCNWMNSCSECGPCASHTACASCVEPYSEGDLIIQCIQCERWLHGVCDAIKTEADAEKCAEEGYNCILCRPRDVPPPHLLPKANVPKPPTPTKSPDIKTNASYCMDGVFLSERGHCLIKALSAEQQITRKKRRKVPVPVHDKEAGIMATIESVVAGSSSGLGLDDTAKLEMVDIKDEPQELYKEGMIWTKEDGPPPEGFTVYTMESGVSVLRRKRQRNLQKLGIGGFLVRVRGIRAGQENDDVDMLPGQSAGDSTPALNVVEDKPRRKPVRRKPRSKLAESFPPYLQEAFFGKELLDSHKEANSSSSEEEKSSSEREKTILSQDEVKDVMELPGKQDKSRNADVENRNYGVKNRAPLIPKEEDESDTEALKDVLALPGDLLDTDLVNTIMNEDDDELAKNTDTLESFTDSNLPDDPVTETGNTNNSKDTKDDLSDILGSHFNLESIPNINSKDVEDIFKGVLTDESQESQESNAFPLRTNVFQTGNGQSVHSSMNTISRPTTLATVNQTNLNSPMSFPSQSPYHSEYSNSPQFSPAFSEPPSPWVTVNDAPDMDGAPTGVSTCNQRSSEKMKADEGLGPGATISAVLYVNVNHPEWKTEFPNWSDRYKQIIKKWRTLSAEEKRPYLQKARDNRSELRMKKQKQSQVVKENASSPGIVKSVPPTAAVISMPTIQVPVATAPVSEDQEKLALQQKSAREAEQERQWKQLQALRQQQAQQTNHVIQEQRVQAIARVQRQISDGSQAFMEEQQNVIKPATPQDGSTAAPTVPAPRQYLPVGIKSPPFTLLTGVTARPTTPHDFITSASSVEQTKQKDTTDTYLQTVAQKPASFQSRFPLLQQPPLTSRSQITNPRPSLQGYGGVTRQEAPDINRQLRDLLQKQQQFKKLDEQLISGKSQQRIWPPNDNVQQEQDQTQTNTVDATFRQPLPPGIVRPRMPVPVNAMIRQTGQRLPGDARLQISDSRMRLLIQQRAGAVNLQQQVQTAQMLRFPQGAAVRMASVEHNELLLQQDQKYWANKHDEQLNKQHVNQQMSQAQTAARNMGSAPSTSSSEQEIPDNVTAELEKLEEESGTMVELHSVGDILGGLGEDEDDILAEMGADFNILEYADPELEALRGEKTNILDNLDLVEPEHDKDDKNKQQAPKMPQTQVLPPKQIKTEPVTQNMVAAQVPVSSLQPPPLAVSQPQNSGHTQFQNGNPSPITLHQQHQQMLQQVQQAAALGRPMAPGTKLMSPDGVVGIVTPNNTVSLTFPPNYQQRMLNAQLQLQNAKIQMRPGQQNTRVLATGANALHGNLVGLGAQHRLNVASAVPTASAAPPPPPPPPPYPGPPPPYPGSAAQEQPLLLEELLEQEKREQEKQMQNQPNSNQDLPTGSSDSEAGLLSEQDFAKLKVDVLSSAQVILPTSSMPVSSQVRNTFINRSNTPNVNMQWQPNQVRSSVATPQPVVAEAVPPRVPTFNANLLPAPPLPPENIASEQDKQAQLLYEQWLKHQNNALTQQLKFYETEVQKLRKSRKSLNSKQRQLRKSGNQLADADAMELQRISTEQAVLQKHLEGSRKQMRQHGMLIQVYMKEYQNKQQIKHSGQMQSSLLIGQQTRSPLGPPSSSPIHHSSTPQSPMMSPSPSAQHSSPLNSPGPMVSHSPGPGSVSNIMQSPNATMSPRIGTPHSQSDGSPVQSPSHTNVCLPPPAPRMTSPQHRRLVTSPVGYVGDMRATGVQNQNQVRFARPPMESSTVIQQRVRLPSPVQQKPNALSPLNSPPPSQINLALQKHLHASFAQQQQQSMENAQQLQNEANNLNSQRAVQLTQQRQLIFRQQLPQQATQQALTAQQYLIIQHQLAKQQQQQQQPQPQVHMQQAQNRLVQQTIATPNSPIPPKSPLINQPQNIMSPHSVHSQPPSPMPPRSPMVNFGNGLTPNSPMPRSPVVQQQGMQGQPPNSPMMHSHQPPSSPMPRSPMLGHSPIGMRRPPSANTSPAMPERPTSVENPRTPYGMQSDMLMSMDDMGGGGGGGHHNPIPFIMDCGGYGFFKLGLRGGAPMWGNMSRGAKKLPSSSDKDEDGASAPETAPPKHKRESHLNKVSILKKKSPMKVNLLGLGPSKVSSLVSTDYNEFDDSSCTPPVTPPPLPTTSRVIQKVIKKTVEPPEVVQQVLAIDSSPDEKEVLEEMMDYDDDNDNTVVSTEVTLSSAAQQNDGDDIAVIESYSQNDITDVMSSPMESDQIADEFVLFHGNMVVDISGEAQYSSDKDDDDDDYQGELVNLQDKNMQIVNVAIQSPTTSEEELIMQGKTKKVTSGGLTLNIVQGLSSNHLLTVSDTPDSPGQEEELLSNFEDSEIVIIDPSVKSPEEQISTKEDFEELIDEGSRKEKIIKPDPLTVKHINEIHKYTSACSYAPKKLSNAPRVKNVIGDKFAGSPTKISLIATSESPKPTTPKTADVRTQSPKLTTSCTILPVKPVKSNIISVPKLVTSVSPAITIVSASTSQIASILPSRFTVPVLSASVVSKLPNVKVIDKPSTSLSLATHDACLPRKIFEDDSVSSDNSMSGDAKKTPEATEKASGFNIQFNNFPKSLDKKIQQSEKQTPETSKEHTFTVKHTTAVNTAPSESFKEIFVSSCEQKKQTQTVTTSKPSMLMHNTPELKMTAQIIQEAQGGVHITQNVESISASFMTSQLDAVDGNSCDLDNKSVVISIPSPTPSQEQMLNNIALQALENRRRDGSGITGEFESFEDVLDMIENITGEPPTVIEDKLKKDDLNSEKSTTEPTVSNKAQNSAIKHQTKVATSRSAVMSQLSPLSQPGELTSNMANVSQQLRTLLSSLHTTTVTSSSNVETVVKSVTHKEKLQPSTAVTSSSIITARILQQVDKKSTVIVPNLKQQKVASTTQSTTFIMTSAPNVTSTSVLPTSTNSVTATVPSSTPVSSLLTSRTVGRIKLMPDHPKLPPVTTLVAASSSATTTIVQSNLTSNKIQSSSATTSSTSARKSLSLNAMLQSHPAATAPQMSPGSITTASILGPSLGIMKTGFNTSLVQAHPKVQVEPPVIVTTTQMVVHNANSFAASSSNINTTVVSSPSQRPVVSTTNFLHTHLTKAVKTEEQGGQPEVVVKQEEKDVSESQKGENSSQLMSAVSLDNPRPDLMTKFTTTTASNRMEDSQNVLLKQLLQNTACASAGTVTTSASTPPTAPSLPIVPNLEAQLARPVPPTPTSLLPPILQNEPPNSQANSKPPVQRAPVVSRETSFISKPPNEPQTTTLTTQQLHIDTKKCLPPSRTPSRDDLLSPQTPRSSCSQDSSLHTPPLSVKKETGGQQNPFIPQEVKKELVDESSQHSEVSDHSRPDLTMKEELTDCMDPTSEKSFAEQKEELKKMKRRMYQQKRRQNHILNKEIAGQPKKRPRKSSKVDEDYDSYIDGVLAQLRTLPPMAVSEPVLNRNFLVVPIFGSGDLSKMGTKEYDTRFGDLTGTYGNAIIPDVSDFYNTKPYGDADPLPEKTPASTQRGFYDQEFPIIKFDAEEDKKFDLFCRDDSPDSIISSSSPECVFTDPLDKFPGLKLISDDEDEDEEVSRNMTASPVVPIIVPIPIRLKPAGPYLKDYPDVDKENVTVDYMNVKSKFGPQPNTPLKDSGNVTVTLTLTSSAAEDIMGVLRDLANILHIPAPTSYQIVERTSTPPSQKLGLYRTKGKDGKEGAPIDIQSILNGAAKFCRHCDVVILNNMIKKKVSDLPFLTKDTEFLGDDDDLFFCSSTCFMQFALMHRSPSITEDKAAAIINHLCQKDKIDSKKKIYGEQFGKRSVVETMEIDKRGMRKEFKFEPMEINSVSFEKHFQIKTEDSFNLRLPQTQQKSHKGSRYKFWTPGCLQAPTKYKKPTDKEIMELLYKLSITVSPQRIPEDVRKCMFCHNVSDGVADGPARLLNFDVDKWVHLNCGLWSDGVYETVNGALMNLENALQTSLTTYCVHCSNVGATIRCFKTRCSNVYHLGCAVKDSCVFYKNKTMYCTIHALRTEKDNELTTLSVSRRVYVNRDENRQVAAVMHHSDTSNLLRVGSLIFLNVGQLLPHQLQNFHTANYIYPIGYKIIRFYWSMRRLNKRCRYICSINEVSGRPEFRVVAQEPAEDDVELRDSSPKGVWSKILEALCSLRREHQCIQIFPKYVSGEDLFGLTEPAVVRVLESLPGVETLTDYKFKYGRNPLLELPLAINPSGAARTEPRLRNQLHWKRPHTQRTGSSVRPVFVSTVSGVAGETACPYSKQFVHSKSSQYKKMKQEWRNNVYLARSKIQGLGLYAARDLEKHTMVIEYIGEIIRTELAETREKKYEAKNRGIYMFRLDEERVVDATLCGGLARYINHSCNPNCVAEIVEVDRDLRIIIFAKRRIQRGEELAYDYKFDIEDDQHKISCMCGAPNCRKWMN